MVNSMLQAGKTCFRKVLQRTAHINTFLISCGGDAAAQLPASERCQKGAAASLRTPANTDQLRRRRCRGTTHSFRNVLQLHCAHQQTSKLLQRRCRSTTQPASERCCSFTTHTSKHDNRTVRCGSGASCGTAQPASESGASRRSAAGHKDSCFCANNSGF
jgi:hypothetical protein